MHEWIIGQLIHVICKKKSDKKKVYKEKMKIYNSTHWHHFWYHKFHIILLLSYGFSRRKKEYDSNVYIEMLNGLISWPT